MLQGNLVIALGTAANSIVGTQPNGCMTNYSVAANVATEVAGQSCTVNITGGTQVTTPTSHTLTLSSDQKSLAQASAGTRVDTVNGVATTCTYTTTGTYTKQ
jgi:hypothetical protein